MSVDKALFRQAAGSFATGVTVITTGRDGVYHGMTASAFTSVSLEPTQILICVDRTAVTLDLLHKTGHFNVNVLAADQEQLARAFATKESPESHGLNGVDYRMGETGLPLLNGALAYLECRTVQQFDGGDHVIFLGEVENAGVGDASDPLLYFRGRYRQLGNGA